MLYIENIEVPTTIFPDNASQVWKLPESFLSKESVTVTWDFCHEGEFMQLAQLKSLLDSSYIDADLYLPYLPYGRQDKDISNNFTFALHTFAKLLNTLNFMSISINDPHSDIALNLINNSKAHYPIEKVENLINRLENPLICYPDSGALHKYSDLYHSPYIFGIKDRNQLTGHIESYTVINEAKITGHDILIVDDICDGGSTFELLTDKLIKCGAKKVYLFVTHGIFSKGLKGLKNSGISRIFTNKGEAYERQKHIYYKEIK